MTKPAYTIEPFSPRHDRAAFTCGVEALDTYIQRQARQDVDRGLAAISVLPLEGTTIAGFYTLSAYTLQATDLPVEYSKKLPRFPIPVTLLGRMAVATAHQGQRLGELLLAHALRRAWRASEQIASWAVIVDAKVGARDFYLKHDFLPLPEQPDRLFLPMKTIAASVASDSQAGAGTSGL